MTKEDALLYFPLSNEDDIIDLYDDLLFEQKQFLSNRMPISKVFKSRISKLNKIEEAFSYFGGHHEVLNEIILELTPISSDFIEEAYQTFQQNLNKIKLGIFKAQTIPQLLVVIELLFQNQREFAEKFETLDQPIDSQPILSKEPDAMEIIQAISHARTIGITKFNELSQLTNDNILVQEANRLSLWLKLETNV